MAIAHRSSQVPASPTRFTDLFVAITTPEAAVRPIATMRLLSNSFGREAKNEDYEEAFSDELTADFQTSYLHRRYQEHQEETP